MQVQRITGTRGHINIELSDGRYVYVPGELTLGSKFYAVVSQDWYWVKKPIRYFLSSEDEATSTRVTDEEKKELMAAVELEQRERIKKDCIRIIFD